MKGGTSSNNRGQHTTSKTDKQVPHGKFQPTAEQVRFSKLLNQDEPKWLTDCIEQVHALTQKPHDEVAIALHDCDNNIDTAVLNLLEGKYDQGEWITLNNRKKKVLTTDTISPVNIKEKPPSKDDRRDNRESSEFNNRRNKNQSDRIQDGNNVRQNGPLNPRPVGGKRNRNRDEHDERQGERDNDKAFDQRNSNRRGEGENRRSDQQDDRRSRNDFRGRSNRNGRGGRGGRLDRLVDGMERQDQKRERWNNNDQENERGDRRFGRGGFGRRGGTTRGNRGGRGSFRGDRYNNNQARSDRINGQTKNSDLKSTQDWDSSPPKEDLDWGLSEPVGATEDWGAEDWVNEKLDDSSNMPSWAATDNEKDTWENENMSKENLSNHVNHLPECDDEAILSSKLASQSSSTSRNLEEMRISTPANVSSHPYTHDSSSSFPLSSNISTTSSRDDNITSMASAGLSKINHRLQGTNEARVHSSSGQVTLAHSLPNSDQQQPQRQQKTRLKRIPKGQVPKQAVEMPGNNAEIDAIDVQFGNLDFASSDSINLRPSDEIQTKQQEESIILSQLSHKNEPTAHPPPAVQASMSNSVSMVTTSLTLDSSMAGSYEEMSPRQHYAQPNTKSAMTQMTPDTSPQKEKLELPKTPPLTKKVDVSTSPMPMTATMTSSIAKSSTEDVGSRVTSLSSQIEAIATSDNPLDDRAHQQAPAPILHHSDQNTLRSRPYGVGMSNGSKANGGKANGTPAGVNLNNGTPPGPSTSGGPPPGIISGIQPSTTAKTTSSSNVNRATAHGSTKPASLPPGVMPLYGMQPAGFPGFSPLAAFPLTDDLQMLQRMTIQPQPPYYDMQQFPVSARDSVQNSYTGTDVKYNRSDTSSPVPSSLTPTPHGQQGPFINTHAQLHPFGYAGNLAFYHGGGMIGGFAPAPYTTQMYQLPTKAPGVTTQFQQNFASQLGPHYTSGYDGLTNAPEFNKQGYQHSASKANAVSGNTVSNSGTDLSSPYKTQFTDKGYLSGTPPLNISLPGQAHQPHPAGFPLMPVLAPTQPPPSLFQSHPISHQQLDNLNQNRGTQNQGKVPQNKSHHGHSIYPTPFWSGTNN
ncbi:ubiquitin-associated protein 2-like [Xenia sp. Carnegie-2017]|uniref:ubiquitin-associated protein 2-like n=1 Tax=Xenia sp. Carnegie-2017 TaxID=2897299 RepID=UPI001F04FEEB|nr:ubiquitin-associated protein 2-like [Xenia sp. Carnegie-2017]